MRYAQLIMGPAGSGKSTYCSTMQKHFANAKRPLEIINLDPAAEHFDYEPSADIRELIQVEDTMEDETLNLGPNGGLIYCMEYLIDNMSWLEKNLGDTEEDYIIFDCPGQIELYVHLPVMRNFIKVLEKLNFQVCSVFLLDVQFVLDSSKFLSGCMAALSVMINLGVSHVNILNKMDLLSNTMQKKIIDKFSVPIVEDLLSGPETTEWDKKYYNLTKAIGNIIENYSMIQFMPLNNTMEESIASVVLQIDVIVNYGELEEVKIKDFDELLDENDENN